MESFKILTRELMRLEKKYWQAMRDHDLKTALSLTDFPCVVAGAQGVVSVDQKQFEAMFNSHTETINSLKFDGDPHVRLLNDDTAIVGYKIHSRVTADGHEAEQNCVDTSTWVKRGAQWKCAMHAEAIAATA